MILVVRLLIVVDFRGYTLLVCKVWCVVCVMIFWLDECSDKVRYL